MPLDGRNLYFVLSAGRTGTYFLTAYLNKLDEGWVVEHEIRTSHRVFMMMNAAALDLFPKQPARAMFARERAARIARLQDGQRRVEINPFLSPLAPELPGLVDPLHVVCLVRDPRTWIRSIANFKGLRWKRHFVDYVPFAQSIHPEIGLRWLTLPYAVKSAWRWRFAYEQILAIRDQATRFDIIRYEDLFAGDAARWQDALGKFHANLDIPDRELRHPEALQEPINMAPRDTYPPWSAWPDSVRAQVLDVCGPLMETLGYDPDAEPLP